MVHVFKTSVRSKSEILKLKPQLNRLAPEIKWNFDLEDCDNILRIDSQQVIPDEVINLLKIYQFECEELI